MKKVLIIVAALALAIGAIGAGVSLAQAASLPSAQGTISSAVNNAVTALSTATGISTGSTDTNRDGDKAVHSYLEEAFAKALGMTLADFDTQEAAGQTWTEIATAQGKTETEAQALLATAYRQSIDQALADGKITQAQADTLKTGTVPTLANMGMGRHGGKNGDGAVHSYLEEAFAKALGMTLADFDTQEAAGKTWTEIATAQGKTADEAQALLATAYSQSIDLALADGKITQAQADTLKAGTVPTLTTMGMGGHGHGDGTFPGGNPGGRGHRHDDPTSSTQTNP